MEKLVVLYMLFITQATLTGTAQYEAGVFFHANDCWEAKVLVERQDPDILDVQCRIITVKSPMSSKHAPESDR